jgi:hypothetical protein
VPKRQFSASKQKKEGEPAFSDFIGFYFIYRTVGIYGFYPGRYRPDYSFIPAYI